MVIAVITVGVVQVTVDKVVDVVTVRDGLVPAPGAVHVRCVVCAALVARCARLRVCPVNRQGMLINVAIMGVMEVTIVQVVNVTLVHQGCVTAIRAMSVRVVCVDCA